MNCPKCQAAIEAGSKLCTSCGSGVVEIRLRFAVHGETRIVTRLIACDPDEVDELEGSEPMDVENPEELPGREN